MRLGAQLVAVAALAIAGCGDDEDEPASSPVESTELTVTLDADGPGGDQPLEAEFSCPGANAPRTACEAVADLPEGAADPVPPSTPCTEIYGGADEATIEGTLEGEDVDAMLTRSNGCEIERFERFAALFQALFPKYEPGASLAP